MATKALESAPKIAEPQTVGSETTNVIATEAAPAIEPNGVTEGSQDETKVEFVNAQDFPPDAEDLEDEEGETLKITFPNGEVYEADVVKVFIMPKERFVSFEKLDLSITEECFVSLVDNILCWSDFDATGRTPGYDYNDNWLRAIKEVI